MAWCIKVPTITERLGLYIIDFVFSISKYEKNNTKTILHIVKYTFRNRFSVAIKSSKLVRAAKILKSKSPSHIDGENKIDKSDVMIDPDIDLLMNEAKTMFSIDGYHENIVNLQGIGYEADFKNGTLDEVSKNMKTSFYQKKNDLLHTIQFQGLCKF